MKLNLSRRTVIAPTPGLVGGSDGRRAVFGVPNDELHLGERSGHWYAATLHRGGKQIAEGYVIEAALIGQPGHQHV